MRDQTAEKTFERIRANFTTDAGVLGFRGGERLFDLSQVIAASMGSMLTSTRRCDILFPRIFRHDFNPWLMQWRCPCLPMVFSPN